MSFEHLEWLYIAIPLLVVLIGVRFWRRHFWGYSLVESFGEELGSPNPLLRVPKLLEGCAVGFLLIALLGPVYPFQLNRIERGGLQIMFVLDLSQSMEESILPRSAAAPLPPRPAPGETSFVAYAAPGSKMEAIKNSALEFIRKREGDAIGLVVFSNNGYLVSPATFDHESLVAYLKMTGTHTLVNEGFTAIGEGLAQANQFFAMNKRKTRRRAKGQVIILLTDGDNNYGRDPMVELERAQAEGTRVYYFGVALQPGSSEQLAQTVPSTGGHYFDVRDPRSLERAFEEVDQIEKGVFYTLQLRENQPAYFVFVVLALACLALRVILHAVPHFVELS